MGLKDVIMTVGILGVFAGCDSSAAPSLSAGRYNMHREIQLYVASSLEYNTADVHISLDEILQECTRYDSKDKECEDISKEVIAVMTQVKNKITVVTWSMDETTMDIPYAGSVSIDKFLDAPSANGSHSFLLPPYIPTVMKQEVALLQKRDHPYAGMLKNMLEKFSYVVI